MTIFKNGYTFHDQATGKTIFKNGYKFTDLGGEHTVKSYGICVACHHMTWGYTDHECPDFRGPFGDRTHDAFIADEYDMQGPDVPICALCMNTQGTYKRGLEIAKRRWGMK